MSATALAALALINDVILAQMIMVVKIAKTADDHITVQTAFKDAIDRASEAISTHMSVLTEAGHDEEVKRLHNQVQGWLTLFEGYNRTTLAAERAGDPRAHGPRPAEPARKSKFAAGLLSLVGKDDKAHSVLDKSVAHKLLRQVLKEIRGVESKISYEINNELTVIERKLQTLNMNVQFAQKQHKPVTPETLAAIEELKQQKGKLKEDETRIKSLGTTVRSEQIKEALE